MEFKAARQLMDEGTYHEVRRRAAAGAGGLWRPRRGVYGLTPQQSDPADVHAQRLPPPLPETREPLVISHASAAVLYGLPVHQSLLDGVWVTHGNDVGGHQRRWLHTFGTKLDPDEIVDIDGMPVTSLVRTTLELARYLRPQQSISALDVALSRDPGLPEAWSSWIAAHPRWRGNGRATWVLALANPLSESWGESVSRIIMAEEGIPAPVLQYPVYDEQGELVAVLDFFWEEFRVAGEYDGLGKYDELLAPGRTAAHALRRLQNRDEWLKERDIWTVHWGADNIAYPKAFAAQLRRALQHRGR